MPRRRVPTRYNDNPASSRSDRQQNRAPRIKDRRGPKELTFLEPSTEPYDRAVRQRNKPSRLGFQTLPDRARDHRGTTSHPGEPPKKRQKPTQQDSTSGTSSGDSNGDPTQGPIRQGPFYGDPPHFPLPKLSVPPAIRPPESQFKPGPKAVPETFEIGEHLYVAALLQVKKETKKKSRSGRKNQDHRETWCVCRKPDEGNKMIQCQDPKCEIRWWHLSCIEELEYAFAEQWEMWLCERCWRKRCVDFFKANPRAYINGVSGVEDIPDNLELLARIRQTANLARARKEDELELETAFVAYHARRQATDADEGAEA